MGKHPGDNMGQLTMREARARYFEANGFGADGGYTKAWDLFKFGPIPIPIPNLPARRQALQFHDLNHIITGYETDWKGEFEIAAWEMGAGCGRLWFAWMINLSGIVGSALLGPRAIRAFARGRRSRSLYELPVDELLDMQVDEARRLVAIDRDPGPARPSELLAFAAWWLLGTLATLLQVAVPLALLVLILRAFVG
jgi:hypothetical protein